MSQRRQDARKAQQERRRQERRDARVQQRRTTPSTTSPPATPGVTPARPGAGRTATPLKRGRRPRGLYIGAGVAGVLLVALGAYLINDLRQPLPGVKFESNGNAHVSVGEPHGAYFSNPPTSGWHLVDLPRPGIFDLPMSPEALGHHMEHGGVWMLYSCPEGCPDVVAQLTEIEKNALDKRWPVSLAPYPPPGYVLPEKPINIITWQYQLALDAVDKGKIEEFVERHKCRYTPEGTGFGCTQAKRGDSLDPKDAGEGGLKYQAPPGQATAAATPAPTPSPTTVAGPTGPTTTAATTTPAATVTATATPAP
jgi:hypothetical protein